MVYRTGIGFAGNGFARIGFAGVLGLLCVLPGAVLCQARATAQPEFLGVTNRVSESRGAVAVNDPADGRPLIAAFALDNLGLEGRRTSLLLIDAQSGKSEQHWFPQRDTANGQVFHLLRSSKGRLYTTIGQERRGQFVEFDIGKRQWSFSAPTAGIAMSFTEAPGGLVYYATYPDSMLYEFDPVSRRHRAVVRMDEAEMYPTTLAADDEGWVYAGIGTARSNIVGVHPASGKRHALLAEGDRLLASGEVYRGADGAVYARASRTIKDSLKNPWYRLSGGKAQRLDASAKPELATASNIHFYHTLADFPGGGRIDAFLMPERRASMTDAQGRKHTVRFDYETQGAFNTAITAGTDGMIYGTTNHPNWVFRYNPQSGEFLDMGSLYGGLMTNLAAWGKYIAGASYPNGNLYLFDTTRDWQPAEKGAKPAEPNPALLTSFAQIRRPRTTRLLADGRTLVVGGFPGYGHVAGALALYNLADGSVQTWSPGELLPGHSPYVIRELRDGRLAVGTSTEAPGGGHRRSSRAAVFLFDRHAQAAELPLELPVAEVRALAQLDEDRLLVFGAGGEGARAFVLSMKNRKVLSSYGLDGEGAPLNGGHSLLADPRSGHHYALLPNAIARVREDGTLEHLHRPEQAVTSGAAIVNGELYYVCGPRLMRLKLEPEHPQ